MADLMQRIACNRAHSSEARCACWLLKTSDRVGDDAFELRHATLATMLGVRRATVTDSLARLQRTGTVRSSRGTITVLDRRALEAAACDCSAFFRRVLPMTAARPVSSSAAV
ncbi:MAG: helix-turn-helix domain-containing protein [Alphaproteobacteria bacterium]|nr:MAG: helix-turn-helix domain-containing protein [Alphaproteobacteria bacterium]